MLELFRGRPGRVAVGLFIGEFATATQMLIIATIMPRIVADLRGLDIYGFASGAFVVANFISLPFAGPLADRIGLRKVFALAVLVLGAGLIASALAQTMPQFIGARFIEGLGAGFDYAVSFTAIAKTFDARLRPSMFALISAAWVVPALIGPATGAFIAIAFGWRAAFAVFVPFIGVAALLAIPALPSDASNGDAGAFDAVRMLFSHATLRLKRGTHASFVAFALLHAAFFGADAYVSLMLINVRGLSVAGAALCVTLGAVGWSAMSVVQPKMFERYGAARVLSVGALLGFAAICGVIAADAGAPVWWAFAGWLAGGAGVGLSYPTISIVSLRDVEEDREGTVSSATLLAAMAGTAMGILIGGIPVLAAGHELLPLRQALLATFAIALVPMLALWLLRRRLEPQIIRS